MKMSIVIIMVFVVVFILVILDNLLPQNLARILSWPQ